MKRLSTDERRQAAIDAPFSSALLRDDTRVIRRPGWYQVVTPSSTAANEVAYSQVAEADAEAAIDEVIATYRAVGRPIKWCVGPWTKPSDFGARLERRGFSNWDVAGMGCETDGPLTSRSFDDCGARVVEVDHAAVSRFITSTNETWQLSTEDSESIARSLRQALDTTPRVTHLFGAVIGDDWVGTAALVLRGDYGYLLGTQVRESARGRGIYKALVLARLALLRERGVSYAVTQARAHTSAPILERLGFETLFRSKCYLLE